MPTTYVHGYYRALYSSSPKLRCDILFENDPKKVPFRWENDYALRTRARIGTIGFSNNFWPKFLSSVRFINPGTFT